MKFIYAILALVLIVGLYFWFTSGVSEAPTPVSDDNSQTSESIPSDAESAPDVETNQGPATDGGVSADSGSTADVEIGMATERVFNLDAFNYGYSETELIVEEGATVTINLTSTEGFHDWVIDEFDAATDKISAGESTSVTFVADRTGQFEFYCSVGSHRLQGMVGTFVVEPR